MAYNFDEIVKRSGTDSGKWGRYGEDVLPMWVADMDFRSPEPVGEALCARVEHGVFGYCMPSEPLSETICERMDQLYGWRVTPDQIMYLPGLVCGLNVVAKAIGEPGDGVLVHEPVYPPFLTAPENQQRTLQTVPLTSRYVQNGAHSHLYYEVDFDAFDAEINDRSRLFILCNPHNPIGRAYSADELTRMAEICQRHDLVICSDEIHSDLLMGDTQHVPIASLSEEIAQRTITLMAPSKTFNLPGLGCSMAIVQNPELRAAMESASRGIVPHVNVLGYVAAYAAYTQCGDWLTELRAYLTANRDFLVKYVNENLPGVRTTSPEATYLAWLDCRETEIADDPYTFFLEKAKVALNNGSYFGPGGEGFVRLNYGCPRALLEEGLERMCRALT